MKSKLYLQRYEVILLVFSFLCSSHGKTFNFLQVDEILSTVQRLTEFYRSVQEDRMNQILYLLTLVTSIFVPAQFLTGLYGMNFDYMPELGWKYR